MPILYLRSYYSLQFVCVIVCCYHSDKEVLDAHSIQLWSLDQILFLLRHNKISKNDSWILRAVKFLILTALFDNTPSIDTSTLKELGCLPKAPLEISIRQASLQRLHSALTDLSSLTLGATDRKEAREPAKDHSSKSQGHGVEEESAVDEGSGKRGGRRFRLPGVMENGGYFLTALVQFIDEIKREGGITLVEEFTDEVRLSSVPLWPHLYCINVSCD